MSESSKLLFANVVKVHWLAFSEKKWFFRQVMKAKYTSVLLRKEKWDAGPD